MTKEPFRYQNYNFPANKRSQNLGIAEKMKTAPDVSVAFSSFFTSNRDWQCEPDVNDLCAGLSICSNLQEFTDLMDRIESVTEGLAIIDEAIKSNTHIGSSLQGWPKGRKFLSSISA